MGISAPRWTRIGQVFSSAKEIEPSEREAFVRKECAGDADLEREVFRLLELDDRAGSFLEQPAASIQMAGPPLSEGDMLADRYRILGLIGRGGMSDVYEAHDDVIGDVVALKVARPGLEPIHALEARWRREVLLARKVSHSGVCRVHDVAIHHQDGRELLLLTMERLNGESLESRMQRHDARLEEVLDLARQVGAALDAAHGEGVLHRDIKPDNILLEPRGEGRIRAVLTDFGLARHAAPDAGSPVTEAGFLAGTPGYLAPELLRGDPPSIRSDLYAFALVIHNLLVGVTPVLDRRVSAVFARATSPDPSARYGSAHTFVDALTSATTGGPSRWLRFAKRKEALVGGVVILVLALSVFLFRLYQQATPTVSVASQILLTEMVNGTDDGDFEGATEVLRSQLDQSPHFELLERERVRDVLTRMARPQESVLTPEVAREVAMREGVPLVVYSALTRLGADYVLNVKLEQVGARPSFARRTWTQTFSAPDKSALFETMHGAAVWIRQMVGEVPSSLEAQDRASSETTTSSWEALRLFKRANDLSATGHLNDATLVLERAIRIDPEFAMAQTRLGDILISLRRDKEGYAAWQRVIELASRRRLTSREALRIQGQYFDDTGALAVAEKAYRTYWIHYPNDFYAAFLLGGVLIELNRASEAVPLLEKAQTLRPKGFVAAVHLARTRLDLGRVKDAETTIAQLDGLGAEADGWARWLRALSIFITGDLDRAMEVLSSP